MKVKMINSTKSPLPSKSPDQGMKKKKKTLQNSPSIVKAVKKSTVKVQPTAITKKKKSVNDTSDVAMEDASSTSSPITKDDVTNSSEITTTTNGAIKKKLKEVPSLNTKQAMKKKKKLQNSLSIVKAVKKSTVKVQPTAITKKKKSVNDTSDVAMEDASSTSSPITKDDVTNSSEITTTNKGAIKKKSKEDPSLETKLSRREAKKCSSKIFKKSLKERREEEQEKTVFVGNVSLNTTRLDISRFFSKYGKVETVRLRSAAVASPEMSKKESINTGKFHKKRTSVNAYVRFQQKETVEEALAAHGTELMGKHLLVDKAVGGRHYDEKNAVFVGNLTFEAEEEILRAHFAECGEIDCVRIIRSKKIGSGKGFGYVNFKSTDAVEIALRLNNVPFMNRQLRVQRCERKSKKVKASKKVVKKVPGQMGLGFLKPNKDKKKTQAKKKVGGNFSGVKMVETKKFKKMKKSKGKLTKADWKKKAVAHQLTGTKPKVKKTA